MCIEYTYSWPTFNGALVDEMSPNPVYFSKFSWGAYPHTLLALACEHLHHQKLHFS